VQKENRTTVAFTALRVFLLRSILQLAGFCKVAGHLVFSPQIKRDSIVIDFGANRGAFSNEMAERFHARCFAVEPDRSLFLLIDDRRTTKFNVAITARDGPSLFFQSTNSEAGSVIRNLQDRWPIAGESTVEGLSWKGFLREAGLTESSIDVLKMDVEGAELDIIESFSRRDLSRVKQITVEFHDWLNEELHARTLKAIRRLTSMDFIGVTDAPNHSWPVELLFVNRGLVEFNRTQKALLKLYAAVTYLDYSTPTSIAETS